MIQSSLFCQSETKNFRYVDKEDQNASYLNFCPPTDASYINPPFSWLNTITPSLYFTLAAAPAVTATADACAENSNLFCLNRSIAAWFSKNITSRYAWPPN